MRLRASVLLTTLQLFTASLLFASPLLAQAHAARTPSAIAVLPAMLVYKNLSCGCCVKWIALARAAGFKLDVVELGDLTGVKQKPGVPLIEASCHTALAGGYVFEGHVPLDLVRKVLQTRPAIAGLIVPGMPQSSPGMEDGRPHEAYDVLALGRDGTLTIYARR